MKIRSLAVAASGAVAFFVVAGTAHSMRAPDTELKEGKSIELLLKKSKDGSVPVLVFLKEQADLSGADKLATKAEKGRYVYDALRSVAMKTQDGVLSLLKNRNLKFHRFYVSNTIAVEGATKDLIDELAKRDDVAKIVGNPAIVNQLPQSLPAPESFEPDEPGDNLVAVGATKVWETYKARGKGIVVAGQDTGVDFTHPALAKHYRGYDAKTPNHTYNWHDAIHKAVGNQTAGPCGYDSPMPCDDVDHGTHTMGTMVGNDGDKNVTGMAPDAQFIACRNMDQGTGSPETYLECFEYFLAPYPTGSDPMKDGAPVKAPDVMNNSWGCPPTEGCEGPEFLPALAALEKAGVFVVASAGNDGPGCSSIQSPPAHYTDVTFSVGALDHRNGEIAFFSSRGPSKYDGGLGPDVSAPGVNILSTVPGGQYAQFGWSGTSMAGPHVAGLVALMWSANPKLIGQVEETAKLIRETADPKTTTETCGNIKAGTVPNNTYGYGEINAMAAVKAALAMTH